MVAAITPTFVAEEQVVMVKKTGTAPRIRRFYIKGPKAAAGDWFELQSILGYADITSKIASITATTQDFINDYDVTGTAEYWSYDDSADRLFLSGSGTGPAHVWVDVIAES